MNGNGVNRVEAEYIHRHHRHEVRENQCSSAVVKHIKAPVPLVGVEFWDVQNQGFNDKQHFPSFWDVQNLCSSAVVKHIKAPVPLVRSLNSDRL